MTAAAQGLRQALSDGDKSHAPGSWQTDLLGEHINHLRAHLNRLQAGEFTEEHLSHIVCRALMVYAAAPRK